MLERTPWLSVILLFLTGCSTALHIGKIPSALPLMRESWQLSLTQTGLILSTYAILIATGGLFLGMLVQRVGYARFAILGVGIVGVGSLLGAQSESLPELLVTRALEGLGWIMSTIALPPLLSSLSQLNDRALVMGIWGAFVPIGAGTMLLLSPFIQSIGGWQLAWIVAGVASLIASVLIMWITHVHSQQFVHLQMARSDSSPKRFSDLSRSLIWILSACFFLYSFQFLSVTSFLPTLLLDTTELTLSTASGITAMVIISNALGNIAAGVLMRRGVSHVPLLVSGALGMGVCSLVVFSVDVSVGVRLVCAFGFSVLGGLIPGAAFATLPRAVSVASSMGLLIGLMMQSSGAGQLLGGVLIPAAVDVSGAWQSAGMVSLAVGLAGSILALLSRIKS